MHSCEMMCLREQFSYENKNISIYQSDCYDIIKATPNQSIDLIITSPPYCMGKAYERPKEDVASFSENHNKLLPECVRILKKGGSLCWQIGYHVKNGVVVPLDIIVYNIITNLNVGLPEDEKLILRNRLIWTFGHGLNNTNRFSGRHETILWFTKGREYEFHLDDIRVPQKYPGKTYYKGEKKGQFSGNPLGKNPSDVWDIPNVKANHIEKTAHPCQYPVSLPQRLIKALTTEGATILDPFLGSGSTAIAAILEGRHFIGTEIDPEYYQIACERIRETLNGTIKVRNDRPASKPDKKMKVAQKPDHFK